MKKLLIAVLMVGVIGLFAADNYAYKVSNVGRIYPIKIITENQIADYQTQGYTIESNRLSMYNKLVACKQEDVAVRFCIVPTAAEKILAQSKFAKLDIRRAMRAMVIRQTRVAAATYGDPDTIFTVTNEAVLDAILESNETIKKDWNDAAEINLNDPLVIQALGAGNIDVNAVKLQILELQK
jgi:hypothetical protein